MRDGLDEWLFETVLPHWLDVAVNAETGVFVECLDMEGRAMAEVPRRGRVAPRQLFAFARAKRLGFEDARTLPILQAGARTLLQSRSEKQGFPSRIDAEGKAVERGGMLYDHAFVLLAGAELAAIGVEDGHRLADAASQLIAERFTDPNGGYHTVMDTRATKLANPHMHGLEASILHHAVTGDKASRDRVREIADLATKHFMQDGKIAEQRAADFRPSESWVEPGHCYEWAYLLHEASETLNDPQLAITARALFDSSEGHVEQDGLIVDRLDVRPSYRLWPQLERLRCLETFGQRVDIDPLLGTIRDKYLGRGPDAGWNDKLDMNREPISETVPASMLYHLMTALPVVTGRSV